MKTTPPLQISQIIGTDTTDQGIGFAHGRLGFKDHKVLLGSGADIQIGDEHYVEGRHWKVRKDLPTTLQNICSAISISRLVTAEVEGNVIKLRAKKLGPAGNDITLSTNVCALAIAVSGPTLRGGARSIGLRLDIPRTQNAGSLGFGILVEDQNVLSISQALRRLELNSEILDTIRFSGIGNIEAAEQLRLNGKVHVDNLTVRTINQADPSIYWAVVRKEESDRSDITPYVECAFFTVTHTSRINSLSLTPNWSVMPSEHDASACVVVRVRSGISDEPKAQTVLGHPHGWKPFRPEYLDVADLGVLWPGDVLTLEVQKTGLGAMIPGFVVTAELQQIEAK